MKIEIRKEGRTLFVAVEGSVDTMTAPELEKELRDNAPGFAELILDFGDVDYVSSAGLRVLLEADRQMKNAQGKMVVRRPNEDVREVFETTGFDELLDVES